MVGLISSLVVFLVLSYLSSNCLMSILGNFFFSFSFGNFFFIFVIVYVIELILESLRNSFSLADKEQSIELFLNKVDLDQSIKQRGLLNESGK